MTIPSWVYLDTYQNDDFQLGYMDTYWAGSDFGNNDSIVTIAGDVCMANVGNADTFKTILPTGTWLENDVDFEVGLRIGAIAGSGQFGFIALFLDIDNVSHPSYIIGWGDDIGSAKISFLHREPAGYGNSWGTTYEVNYNPDPASLLKLKIKRVDDQVSAWYDTGNGWTQLGVNVTCQQSAKMTVQAQSTDLYSGGPGFSYFNFQANTGLPIVNDSIQQNGKMRFTANGLYVDVTIPEFGYTTILNYGFDFQKLNNGYYVAYDYGTGIIDKRRCECNLLLPETEQKAFDDFILQVATRGKTSIQLDLLSGSGFFPFGPDKGDVGPFYVTLEVSEPSKIIDNPFRYYESGLIMYNTGNWPSYSPPTVIKEGDITLGTLLNLRFPEEYFEPTFKNGIHYTLSETGAINVIDKGIPSYSWLSKARYYWNESNTAAFIQFIETIRTGIFTFITNQYQSPFGSTLKDTNSFNVSIVQDSLEIQHTNYNRFEFDLTLQVAPS